MNTRRVRVTLEGEARDIIPGAVIRVYVDGGSSVLLTAGQGVTVEDIEPARVWLDGDVVQAPDPGGLVYVRSDGEWRGIGHRGTTYGPHADDETTRNVESGFLRVLRYQHDGTSGHTSLCPDPCRHDAECPHGAIRGELCPEGCTD